jgi:hypothetical protein
MLVRLKSDPKTEYHLSPSLAAIFLAIPNTPIELPPPDAARVVKPSSHWAIVENLTAHGAPYAIHAHCDNCKNVSSSSGPTSDKTMVYVHCGVRENPPKELAQQYARMIARSQESQERPRRAPGTVSVI